MEFLGEHEKDANVTKLYPRYPTIILCLRTRSKAPPCFLAMAAASRSPAASRAL
jgi:hypothetical protein